MEATIATLSAQGVGAVTIEEIARRSGVAKTTIYRRYRNADDLLRRIQFEAAIVPDFGDLAPTREGLICMLERIMVNFDGTIGLKAVGAVLSGGDDYLQRLAAQVIGPAQQRFEDFIRRGQRSGVFAASADTAFLSATVLGSMMAAKALRGDSGISDDTSADAIAVWPARMAAFLWPALARTPASA